MVNGKTLTCALGVALATTAVLAQTSQDLPKPTFRSGASAVTVDVSVRDRSRRAITGLAHADFQVFDNGVLQQVDDVGYGKLPIDVTVALDVSFSVSGDVLTRLRQAVAQLMGDLGREDRLKLVLFNMRVMRTIDYTSDVKAVERAMRNLSAGGSTALLDALSVTLVAKSDVDRRQLIVFFTDGSDSTSTTTPEMLKGIAERTRATLTFVMPVTVPGATSSLLPGDQTIGRTSVLVRLAPFLGLFSTLARETGGSILPVGQTANLATTFRTVLSEFRSAYVLYYTPRGVDRTGYHTIDVKVNRDGAAVTARRGYFAGGIPHP
jgi:VWFA-related protein